MNRQNAVTPGTSPNNATSAGAPGVQPSETGATAAPLSEAQRRAGDTAVDAAWDKALRTGHAAAAVKEAKAHSFVAANQAEVDKVKTEKAARAKKLREVARRAKDYRAQYTLHPQGGTVRTLGILGIIPVIFPTPFPPALSSS